MTKLLLLFLLMVLTCGFIGLGPKKMSESQKNKRIEEAQKHLEQGEFYKAGKLAGRLQEQFPQDAETAALIQEIHNRREARYKQLQDSTAEMTGRERQDAIKTREEQAQELLRAGRYAEAADAAQAIFALDPQNSAASGILDEISRASRKEAKREQGVLEGVYQDEVTERVEAYRREARSAAEAGQWGRARFAVEKLLILSPADPEANRLYDVISSRLERKAA